MFYDSEDKYTIPHGVGIPLIVYDPSLTDVVIEGYEDLWNEGLKDNVALIGNFRVIDGIALKTMGESFNVEDTAKIEEAGNKLLELAPNVRAIQDANTQDLLLSGEVAAAFMYTSQVNLALQNNPELKAVAAEVEAERLAGKAETLLANPEVEFNYLWGAENIGSRHDLRVSQAFDIPTITGMKAGMAETAAATR